MKTIKKILMIIAIIIIIVGMFVLGRNNFNYDNGYSQDLLLETVRQYSLYAGISTLVILIYFAIKYIKVGIVRVLTTSILGILGTICFVIAIIAISRMPVSIMFFPIVLVSYVASLLIIAASFEQNK